MMFLLVSIVIAPPHEPAELWAPMLPEACDPFDAPPCCPVYNPHIEFGTDDVLACVSSDSQS